MRKMYKKNLILNKNENFSHLGSRIIFATISGNGDVNLNEENS